MSNRAANATIKGYFYQFDHTVVQILSSTTMSSVITVEGIEDVDLATDTESVLIQCKYYEATEYKHSVIKDAVINMLRHFKTSGCPLGQSLRYRVYGHYNGGQSKLPVNFDIAFLKAHLLTYTTAGVTHEVHAELSVSDDELDRFRAVLEIDIHAQSYDDQQAEAKRLLKTQIPGCLQEDADAFYYPNAINVIQSLAIQADVNARKITKARFLTDVNRKELVFSVWLRKKFGDDYYARAVKKKHFLFPSTTKVPKSARIFALDAESEFDLSKLTQLLVRIGNRFSHVENTRTLAADRFCPFVLFSGISSTELIMLKENLLAQGVELADGHAFQGAQFSAARLVRPPTKDTLTKLKFLTEPSQIAQISKEVTGSILEIFDFYKTSSLDSAVVPSGIPHNKIKTDTVYFIAGAI